MIGEPVGERFDGNEIVWVFPNLLDQLSAMVVSVVRLFYWDTMVIIS
jgi:hypothetical protein